MKFKSPIFSQASGSIGGMVFSHNRGGMYVRNRSTPTNPQSGLQTVVRNAMAQLSAAWATLSDAYKANWLTYAANQAMVNALGDTVYLTPQQHYVRSNVPRIQNGLAVINEGPTVYTLPTFTPPTFTATHGSPDSIEVAYDDTAAWCDEDDSAMLIQVGMAVSPGKAFFKGPWRIATPILGDVGSPPSTPHAISPAPYPMTADNKVWIRVRLSLADGRLSAPLTIGPQVIA
jgi:hypothetical protein